MNDSHYTESIQFWNKPLFGMVKPTSRVHAVLGGDQLRLP
jgi:hypothetical protein